MLRIFFKAHPAHQQRFLSMEGAEKFLDCFPTCDLVWFLFTLLEYKGADRQSYSHFATETVESQKMEIVSFLFKLQALLSWNLSSGWVIYFPAVSLLSKFLPTSNLNFLLKTDEEGYPHPPLAQMLSAAAGLMQEGLSPSLSWGVGPRF